MKRLFCLLLTLLLCATLSLPASAALYLPEFEVGAQSAYLYNMDSGSLIYEKHKDEPRHPASLTKIMTCILAMENVSDLDGTKVAYPAYIQDYLYNYQWGENGHGAVSLADLRADEVLTMRQLLYAMMLPSGNEAAMIIADHVGGSQEDFVEMMNRRAKELGAKNTTFVNANGLHDPKQVTTAEDMATLTLHALTIPGFEEIVSSIVYESGPTTRSDNYTWDTTNRMQAPANTEYYYPGLKGVKTGSLPEAGDCLVSTCTRDGFTYLLVLLGSPSEDENGQPIRGAFEDTRKLYDWVFSSFKRKSLVEKGKHVDEVPLNLSLEQDYIKLMTGERFTALVHQSTEAASVTMVTDIPDAIDAPVKKGDYVGDLRLILGGEELGRVPLLAAETVEASTVLVIWKRITEVLKSFWFKFLLILIVLLILFYIILIILRNRRRKQKGGYQPRRRL